MFNMFVGFPDPASKKYFDKIIEKSQGPKPYFVYDGTTIVSVDVDNMPTNVYDEYATALSISNSTNYKNFKNKLVSLNMPNVKETISLYEATNLSSVVLGIEDTEDETLFHSDKNLVNVKLDNLKYIRRNGPFTGCTSIKSLYFPQLESIEDEYDLGLRLPPNLQSFIAPNLKKVGNLGFCNCYNSISTIEIPECSSIGNGSFVSCTKLKEIKLPKLQTFTTDSWSELMVSAYFGKLYNHSLFLESGLKDIYLDSWTIEDAKANEYIMNGLPNTCTLHCKDGDFTYIQSGPSIIDIPAVKSDGTYATYSDVMTLYGNNDLAGILALFPSEGTIGYGDNMYNVQTAVGTALQGSSVDENITVGAYYSADKSHVFARFTINSDNAKVNSTTYQVVATGLNAGLYDSYSGITNIKSNDDIYYVQEAYFTMYDSTAASLL